MEIYQLPSPQVELPVALVQDSIAAFNSPRLLAQNVLRKALLPGVWYIYPPPP